MQEADTTTGGGTTGKKWGHRGSAVTGMLPRTQVLQQPRLQPSAGASWLIPESMKELPRDCCWSNHSDRTHSTAEENKLFMKTNSFVTAESLVMLMKDRSARSKLFSH